MKATLNPNSLSSRGPFPYWFWVAWLEDLHCFPNSLLLLTLVSKLLLLFCVPLYYTAVPREFYPLFNLCINRTMSQCQTPSWIHQFQPSWLPPHEHWCFKLWTFSPLSTKQFFSCSQDKIHAKFRIRHPNSSNAKKSKLCPCWWHHVSITTLHCPVRTNRQSVAPNLSPLHIDHSHCRKARYFVLAQLHLQG